MLRRRLLMMTRSMYRWMRLRCGVVMGRKAVGQAAPGEDGVSRKAAVIGRAVNGTGQPATDSLSARGARPGRLALGQSADTLATATARAMRMARGTLSSYGVQLITVIREFILGRRTQGEAAPGAVGISRKVTQLKETTDSERADAEITEAKRAMRTGHPAPGGAFDGLLVELGRALRMGIGNAPETPPAEEGAVQRALTMGIGSEPETPPAADGMVRRALVMGLRGRVAAATWVGPTVVNDKWLLIGQVRSAALYEARVGGNGLEVR